MIDDKTLFRLVTEMKPFVLRLTRSPHAADEVLQEVFLKILLNREKLAAAENPKAYIIRIVSNESVNYLRAQARNGKLLAEMRPLAAGEAPSPEQSLFYREMELQLNEAVERLPLACRKVYRMSREQYMRIPEIAQALNLSDSTVKNQLVKALKNLRRVVLHIGFFVL
ncbi:sigma-70 family RNA polymerase sigma factor [Puia dinghuensis]|uniref:RNA polymerase sigma factor n=1 Tax=Puia dinghuensis TaxID=1792502 RepID=A0A8J2XRM5_9BACT|nr:sigma-70 family RNA polymerase sigma factor [Puia dinghuensis]GGA89726.1 DNA-directed RNA polymerase sigma-70 factor [Puia dinghuensis]